MSNVSSLRPGNTPGGFSDSGISEKLVEIQTPDGISDAWVFHPDSGKWPAVILHTDIKGVRTTFVEAGRRLASLGYFVLLPNLYHRIGRAPVIDASLSPRDEAAKPLFDKLRASITPLGLNKDHVAYLDFLAAQANVRDSRVAVVGYCMSGAIALHVAADFPDRVVAAASFHGGRLATDASGSPHLRAAQLRDAQLYFGYAAEDASMPDDAIVLLEESLRTAGVNFTADHYAGKHGYAVPDSPSYDKSSADLHWQKLAHLLQSALGQDASALRAGEAK